VTLGLVCFSVVRAVRMNCRCCFDFYVLTVLQGSSGDQVSFYTTEVGGDSIQSLIEKCAIERRIFVNQVIDSLR
jgi:hypothetical protein